MYGISFCGFQAVELLQGSIRVNCDVSGGTSGIGKATASQKGFHRVTSQDASLRALVAQLLAVSVRCSLNPCSAWFENTPAGRRALPSRNSDEQVLPRRVGIFAD
jgi:hypothetical protein